jgi:hypothetical protein
MFRVPKELSVLLGTSERYLSVYMSINSITDIIIVDLILSSSTVTSDRPCKQHYCHAVKSCEFL